ncbi:CocE/NonD family hydrolase [Gordonia liuliyuniae]|uniref:CocE/NonD family hydrolase n=1 Tax=Gordonia liuliyuniae TaxID=2911517 RepID=A0ABS9IVX0_9ACTN|nr:CocE/NonD family hydrolase [Gordonia liuliyuniae]MCF8589701.1 CocE/NonD family hydrolase [Gordonia liuliyuniae]
MTLDLDYDAFAGADRGSARLQPNADGGETARAWRDAVDGSQPYPRVHIDRSVTLTMSDGTRLRATVVRPANLLGQPVRTPFPAVLNINPYNRAVIDSIDHTLHAPAIGRVVRTASASLPLGDGLSRIGRTFGTGLWDVFGINRNLVRSGYTQVIVDVRGTGSSHGRWEILSPREQQDSVEVIDWLSRQPWCDGNVGMTGWSYSAINSLQAAGLRPPALKAVFAVEGGEDIVRDVYLTGGMPSAFIPLWLALVNGLKWLPNPATGVADVLRGDAYLWLRDRLKSPASEMPSLIWGFLTARDDRIFDDPYFDERNPKVEQIECPTFTVGGWHDLFGRSATRVYAKLQMAPGRKQMLVADGYHLDPGCDHGAPGRPPRLDVLERAWFDKWLKGIDNDVDGYGPVTMHQQGGSWSCGDAFPRTGVTPRRLFLTEEPSGTADHARHDGSLRPSPASRRRTLRITPDLRGFVSRDIAQVTAGAAIVLGEKFSTDARFQEAGGLSFTSEPVAAPTQVSGQMNLRLNVSTTAHEGIWAVTVNDVAPDGSSRVLTNGALTASNRALDPSRCTYTDDGVLLDAVHYLSRIRRLPVPADEPVRIDVDLVPTDVVLATGHRLRVDVYAASLPRYLTIVPDLIKARGRRQRLVLDPTKPSYLTFQADGDLGADPVPVVRLASAR